MWQRSFLHPRTGKTSTSLREIYRLCSDEERQLSVEFYDLYPKGCGTGSLTPFAGILQGAGPLAGGEMLVRSSKTSEPVLPAEEEADLGVCLRRALAQSLPNTKNVAVAVSGGVDSWLLAAILKDQGYRVCGWYLETEIPGYCEREQVERSSEALGIECRHIRVSADDFVAAAAEFTSATEAPTYSLHPVSKWLLSRGPRSEGITAVVTGDGADQVMRWEWDCDLLPLTMACFQSNGIRMVAPFLAAEVISFCRQPYPDKQPVRKLAQRFGVPTVAKRPAFFPPLTFPSHPQASLPFTSRGSKLAGEDQISCLSYTTGLLQQLLEDATRCAE